MPRAYAIHPSLSGVAQPSSYVTSLSAEFLIAAVVGAFLDDRHSM